MNYHSMPFPQLVKLLKERKLGNIAIFNELNKFYAVTTIPPQQEAARQDAIRQLEEYDKNKSGSRKKFLIALEVIGVIAAVAGVVIALITIV